LLNVKLAGKARYMLCKEFVSTVAEIVNSALALTRLPDGHQTPSGKIYMIVALQ